VHERGNRRPILIRFIFVPFNTPLAKISGVVSLKKVKKGKT